MACYWSISAVPVSAHPPPLVITTKLAAAIHGGVANNKYKYSIQYCPCDNDDDDDDDDDDFYVQLEKDGGVSKRERGAGKMVCGLR